MVGLRELSASLRCYRTRTTADKREIKDFLKLPSATSFIRKMSDCVKTPNFENFLPYFSI